MIPHGVSAGASAAALAHVPTCPGRLHFCSGSVHGLLQHTSSTQLPEAQSSGSTQLPPFGIGVCVGVALSVAVGVFWTHCPSAVQLVPAAQHWELPPTSQQVSPGLAQQTVPPPQSLPLSQQSPNSALQTAAELTQQPPSGQLTPLAQHSPSAVQLVPAAQHWELPPTSQQVSPVFGQQTVPPPQSLPLSQQSPNSALQTAAELAQQPPSGQLTPLAQHSPSAVQLVPAAQHWEVPPTSQQVSLAFAQQTVPPPQSLPLSQQSPNSALQTAAELAQQPSSGQLTPLAQPAPAAHGRTVAASVSEMATIEQAMRTMGFLDCNGLTRGQPGLRGAGCHWPSCRIKWRVVRTNG